MPVRRAASVILLAACSLVTPDAQADSSGHSRETARRTELVLGTIGLEQSSRAILVGLLRAELERAGLSLTLNEPEEPLTTWGSHVTRPERVLAAFLLDARARQGWRLVVIDAARGRAIARELYGGIQEDEASIEAVTSIAVSAALALREGLEVASTPLAAVVGGSAPAPAAPSPRKSVHPARNALPGTVWRPRASVGASVASFSTAVPTTVGLAVGAGLRLRTLAEARVLGTFFVPAHVRGPLGEFRVARAWLGVAAGPVIATRSFSLTPEIGVIAERLSRFGATPAPGLLATEGGGALYRVGGSLSLRLRRTLLPPLSVELVAGALYFGRSARFSARSVDASWSTEASPAHAFAQLGLEVAVD